MSLHQTVVYRFRFLLWMVPWGIVTMLSMMVSLDCSAQGDTTTTAAHPVAFKRIGVSEYQNFLKNWDDRRTPLLSAIMDSAARYEAWFHPAPLNRPNKAFAPEAGFFDKEQILVIARVTAGVENVDAIFRVERVEERGSEIILTYGFVAPGTDAGYTIKAHLAVRIPRKSYARVVFVENGKQVAVLESEKGQWSVPSPP